MARPLALNRSIAARLAIFAAGLLCVTAFAAVIVADVSHGQSPPAGPVPAPSTAAALPPSPTLSAAAQAAISERIAQLQAQLGITPAQMPLWSAFAEAMHDNAATTDALFAQRAEAVTTMSAVENMHSYAKIARAYADNTERLAAAFDSLYTSLTDPQKQAADALFREQAIAAAKPQ